MIKRLLERPILATVISILLVILGVIGLLKLPLQRFPDIAPPAVAVTAIYPGANAETILRSVAPSLEESINGVENMTYMTSTASNDGMLVITVYFKLGTNPDQAAVNVQNRVAQAQSQLPSEVIQQGITTVKQLNSFIMAISMYSDDSAKYDQTFIHNYAQINIIPELKRVPGVAQAMVFGGNKDYSMRLWLDPQKMASYSISPNEVITAIQDKNLEAAPGKFGESSSESFEYVIKYKGKFNRPEDYENIVIRASVNGSLLRLKDVAHVEFGAYSYGSVTRVKGKPGINIGIMQLAGTNANDIQIQIAELLKKVSKDFPKGVEIYTMYNTKNALDASIEQVKHTLVEAFILVFLVVFLFLQDFRSTLIPAIAVPVAIIGTFFFMQLFGFSVNVLTLFALVLAIGIVVDDAIVVVEAVHSKMEHEHLTPKSATLSAMNEITGAIISITLVMAAVFLPIGFMEGSTGVFYRQFAFTMAISIIISAVNALTLSPVLAALFLKNTHVERNTKNVENFKERFFIAFNTGFNSLTERYTKSIKFLLNRKWLAMGGLAILFVLTISLVYRTPSGFIPAEDQGFLAIAVSLPSSSSLDRTIEIHKQVEAALEHEPYVLELNNIAGLNIMTNATSPSSGVVFILLKDLEKRGEVKDFNQLMNVVQEKVSQIKGANFFVFTFPTVPGFGNVEGLSMALQDKTGSGDLAKLGDVGNNFVGALMKRKEISFAYTPFHADYPQLEMEIDYLKADQLGVSVRSLVQTMQMFYGSMQVSDFNRFGKYYRVVAQAGKLDRANPSSLDGVYIKNNVGEMVPISELVKLKRVYGTETAQRYNMFNSLDINAMTKPGFSSGDAIKAVQETAAEFLPQGYSYEFSGQTREELSSGGQSATIFLMSLVFIYFLLAAQYESYILPFAVILSIPTGLFGVFSVIGLVGIENNIYVQIALIMLIGLLAKNAILIVEFAAQRYRLHHNLINAALEGSQARLRPIIMTSLAFIVGLIPMMGATGPAAQGNHSISISAASGMLIGGVLGVFIIPVLFIIFQGLQTKISGVTKNEGLEPELNL